MSVPLRMPPEAAAATARCEEGRQICLRDREEEGEEESAERRRRRPPNLPRRAGMIYGDPWFK